VRLRWLLTISRGSDCPEQHLAVKLHQLHCGGVNAVYWVCKEVDKGGRRSNSENWARSKDFSVNWFARMAYRTHLYLRDGHRCPVLYSASALLPA
jgi:hypothetical protein